MGGTGGSREEADECSSNNLPTSGIKERVVVIRSQPQKHCHLGILVPEDDIADRDTHLSFPSAQHPSPFSGDNTWIFPG